MKILAAALGFLGTASCILDRGLMMDREERLLGGESYARVIPEEQVKAGIQAMYQAFGERNLDRVGFFMANDMTCYDATTSRLLEGKQAVLDHFGAILARHKPGEKWESSMEDLEVTISGEVAVALYKIRTVVGGGHALAAVTHLFRRKGGAWVSQHLHRSWNSAE